MHRVFHRRCTFRKRALFAYISVTISIIRRGAPDGNRLFPFPSIRSFLRVYLIPITVACSRLRRSPDIYYLVEMRKAHFHKIIYILRGEAARAPGERTKTLIRSAEHVLESCPFALLQAEIFPAQITKAVPVHCEDHHFFDICELFERRVDFRCYTCICSDAWRDDAAAEFHGRGPCLSHGAFLIQRQGEVWASNRKRRRAL